MDTQFESWHFWADQKFDQTHWTAFVTDTPLNSWPPRQWKTFNKKEKFLTVDLNSNQPHPIKTKPTKHTFVTNTEIISPIFYLLKQILNLNKNHPPNPTPPNPTHPPHPGNHYSLPKSSLILIKLSEPFHNHQPRWYMMSNMTPSFKSQVRMSISWLKP